MQRVQGPVAHAVVAGHLARGAEAMQVTEQGKAPATITYDIPDGYGSEIRYMVECVQKGTPPSIVTGRDGMTALRRLRIQPPEQ